MELNNQDTKTSSKDDFESARASLTLMCSMLARQYLNNDNNSSMSHPDTNDNINMLNTASVTTEDGSSNFVVGGGITIEHINTLRALQETLRIKNAKVAELKALLVQRDAEIQELRSKLDMYRNLYPLISPYGRFTKHRPKGDF